MVRNCHLGTLLRIMASNRISRAASPIIFSCSYFALLRTPLLSSPLLGGFLAVFHRLYRKHSHLETVIMTQELKNTATAITWYAHTSMVIPAGLKVCKKALRVYKTIAAVASIASVSFQSAQNEFFSLIDVPPFNIKSGYWRCYITLEPILGY